MTTEQTLSTNADSFTKVENAGNDGHFLAGVCFAKLLFPAEELSLIPWTNGMSKCPAQFSILHDKQQQMLLNHLIGVIFHYLWRKQGLYVPHTLNLREFCVSISDNMDT